MLKIAIGPHPSRDRRRDTGGVTMHIAQQDNAWYIDYDVQAEFIAERSPGYAYRIKSESFPELRVSGPMFILFLRGQDTYTDQYGAKCTMGHPLAIEYTRGFVAALVHLARRLGEEIQFMPLKDE